MKLTDTKTFLAAAFGTALLTASTNAELVVYEGFDYTTGTALNTLSGGTGFDGAWTSSSTNADGTVTVSDGGLSFSTLDVEGNAIERPERFGIGLSTRTITAAAQTALTADNSTIWFSVLMDPSVNTTGTGGFALNSYGTLIFGDTAFTASANGTAAPNNAGNAFGVGFGNGSSGQGTNPATISMQGVAYNDGTTIVDSNALAPVGDGTYFIVGKIDFAADGSDDVMTLYNVIDLSLALPDNAFATIATDLDQSGFNIVSINDSQTSSFDEIRIGTTLESVGVVPEPSSLALLGLGGLLIARRRRD